MSAYPADHKQQARTWFERLRDRICADFERLEDELSTTRHGDLPAGRFERTSWKRPDPGGGDGGGGMAGVEATRVASSIAPGGGGGRLGGGGGNGNGAQAGRTDEEIQIVFDRYKASLYRLYNRELRNDPTLRGQMVLHLTIEPDGTVSMCELRSTDMNAP